MCAEPASFRQTVASRHGATARPCLHPVGSSTGAIGAWYRIPLLVVFALLPISQTPSLMQQSWVKPLIAAILAVPMLGIFLRPHRFSLGNPTIAGFALFFVYGLGIHFLNGGGYLDGSYYYSALLSFLFYMLGLGYLDHPPDRSLRLMLTLYILAMIAPTWTVFSLRIASFSNWMASTEYLYGSKNSLGVMLATASLASLTLATTARMPARVLLRTVAVLYLGMLGITQCRSALLGFLVAYFIVHASTRSRLVMLAIAACLPFLFASELTASIFEKVVGLQRSAGDLDALSSGRLGSVLQAFGTFRQRYIIGTGNYYIDCMPVSLLTEWGIFGASFLFFTLGSTYLAIFRRETVPKGYDLTAKLTRSLALLYGVVLFLEGIQPFGPGVTTFLFWFLAGVTSTIPTIRVERRG